jgi:hypothetical protein
MKRYVPLTLFAASLLAGVDLSQAQDAAQDGKLSPPTAQKVPLPSGMTEDMFAPPPVPRFMLEKPARPLTHDEMMAQAREAERKAGIRRNPTDSAKQTPASAPKPAD